MSYSESAARHLLRASRLVSPAVRGARSPRRAVRCAARGRRTGTIRRMRTSSHAVVLNRMSPSAYIRGRGHLTFYTLQYLAHLERLGVRVVNGYEAWRTEISKAYQLTLLEQLGLPYPKARVIHHPSQAPAAAEGLRFPVVVKPNIGGSGAGIVRFDTADALARAAAAASSSASTRRRWCRST